MKTKATLPLILILLISGMEYHVMGMSPTPPPPNPARGEQVVGHFFQFWLWVNPHQHWI